MVKLIDTTNENVRKYVGFIGTVEKQPMETLEGNFNCIMFSNEQGWIFKTSAIKRIEEFGDITIYHTSNSIYVFNKCD